MSVHLHPLSRQDLAWLQPVALAYLAELAPDVPVHADHTVAAWLEHADLTCLQVLRSGAPVGFALVGQDGDTSELAEFGIVPAARNAGIGRAAAAACFARTPGAWRLGVASALRGTARFWDRLLPALPGVSALRRHSPMTAFQSHSYTFTYRSPP